MIKAIETIYIAGKMQDDDWRREFFDQPCLDSCHPHKCNPVIVDQVQGETWPKSSNITVCGLHYTGPFFVDNLGGHGYDFQEEDSHGANVSPFVHGTDEEEKQQEVQRLCLDAIVRADLIFAWIDCIDCYGTIAEIGYAKALGKIIWIAGPRMYRDLWFVYTMADRIAFAKWGGVRHTPHKIFQDLLEHYKQRHPHFDSPIEEAFWEAWLAFTEGLLSYPSLIPQYPIGKYRIDFAHERTKTAIELDGHATHSSPDAIAYDRKRQREIEEQGWHVIRFGGKEVYRDASFVAEEVYRLLYARIQGGKA